MSDIYNMVYSFVLTDKIDFPREYFRVLDLKSGVPSDIYCFIKEVNSDTRCEKFLVKYKST